MGAVRGMSVVYLRRDKEDSEVQKDLRGSRGGGAECG